MATSRQHRVAKASGVAPPPPAPGPRRGRPRSRASGSRPGPSAGASRSRTRDPSSSGPRRPSTPRSRPSTPARSCRARRTTAPTPRSPRRRSSSACPEALSRRRQGPEGPALDRGEGRRQGPPAVPEVPRAAGDHPRLAAQADARGRDSWSALLKRAYLAERVDGEIFIRLRRRFVSDGLVLRSRSSSWRPSTARCRGRGRGLEGAEPDRPGHRARRARPAGLLLATPRPPERLGHAGGRPGGGGAVRVADPDLGRRDPALRQPAAPSSLRADSTIIPMLVTAHNLNSWDQAEQARKLVSALFAGFLKRQPASRAATSSGGGGSRPRRRGVMNSSRWSRHPRRAPGGHGCPVVRPAGHGQLLRAVHTRWKHMYMASCCDVSYEDFTGDWRGANDRVWRAGEVQTRLFVDGERDRIERQVLQPIYRALVKLAIEMGLWAPPAGTPPHHVFDCRWTWPGSKNPNEYLEWNAFSLAVQNGFISRDEAVRPPAATPSRSTGATPRACCGPRSSASTTRPTCLPRRARPKWAAPARPTRRPPGSPRPELEGPQRRDRAGRPARPVRGPDREARRAHPRRAPAPARGRRRGGDRAVPADGDPGED